MTISVLNNFYVYFFSNAHFSYSNSSVRFISDSSAIIGKFSAPFIQQWAFYTVVQNEKTLKINIKGTHWCKKKSFEKIRTHSSKKIDDSFCRRIRSNIAGYNLLFQVRKFFLYLRIPVQLLQQHFMHQIM